MSLIKLFSTVDEDFVRRNFNDAGEAEKLIAKHRKKAVITVGVVASFVVVLLVALGYAVMKMDNTKAELTTLESTEIQIDQCMATALQQATDAVSAQVRAKEINRNTLVLLEECKRKKK